MLRIAVRARRKGMEEALKVCLIALAGIVMVGIGGYFLGVDQERKAVLEEVRTGQSDAWKERCFQSDRLEEAREMVKCEAAKCQEDWPKTFERECVKAGGKFVPGKSELESRCDFGAVR